MKNILYILIVLFCHNSYSQNIFEEHWRISDVVGNNIESTQEYILNKIEDKNEYGLYYGTTIIFNPDNTFNCLVGVPCGNDCTPYSSGTYKNIDKKHIELFVEKSSYRGDCRHWDIDSKCNLQLGKYYIYKKSDQIVKLIKSNGNNHQDKLNEKYSEIIDKYIQEIENGSSSLLNFKTIKSDNLERVRDYIKNNTQIKNYKVLFSKKQTDYPFIINLIENSDDKNDQFFIVNGFKNNYECQVGYYKFN